MQGEVTEIALATISAAASTPLATLWEGSDAMAGDARPPLVPLPSENSK